MNKKIGAITIGQSPRVDVIPEMAEILGPQVEILEEGALDGLTKEEIQRLAPGEGDYVLVTRLRDGSSVRIAEHGILPHLQRCIDNLIAKGAEIILLLCTGEFPQFISRKLFIQPQLLLYHLAAGVAGQAKLGIMVPVADQIQQARERWEGIGSALVVKAGSPYASGDEVNQAANALREEGVQLVVMDCIGYNKKMGEEVRRITKVPVILARSIIARVLQELIGSPE